MYLFVLLFVVNTYNAPYYNSAQSFILVRGLQIQRKYISIGANLDYLVAQAPTHQFFIFFFVHVFLHEIEVYPIGQYNLGDSPLKR